jgi:hypothetical protein
MYHSLLLEGGVTGWYIEQTWEQYRLGMVKLVLFYLCTFQMKDVGPIIEWWNADESHMGISFWDVLCRWPSQALEDHGVVDLLAGIVHSKR